METLYVVGLFALVILGVAISFTGCTSHSNAAWLKVAEDFALETNFGDERSMTGSVDGVVIDVCERQQSDGEGSSWITTVRAAGSFTVTARRIRFRSGSIRTGHATFDAAIGIEAPDATAALATLDADARAAIRYGLGANGLRITPAEIMSTIPDRIDEEVALAREVQRIADLARSLRMPSAEECVRKLLDIAENDPVPEVRMRCFERLVAETHTPPEVRRDALRRAAESRNATLRVLGAMLSGPASIAAVRAGLDDPDIVPCVASRALALVAATMWKEEAIEWLAARPQRPCAATARARAELAARTSTFGIGHSGDPENLAAVIELWTRHAGAKDEPTFLMLLDHPAVAVRLAAARFLREHGTTRAIEGLQRRTRLLEDGQVRHAAFLAIAAIRQRTHGEAGTLAFADGARGELGFPQGGELSQ